MKIKLFTGHLPVIHQSETGECGIACLAMISSYHGQKTDLLTMRRKFANDGKGASLSMLMRAATQLGLIPRAVRLDLKELPRLQLPAMLHWDFNHFVVLKAVRGKHAIIHNPALGRRRYTLAELDHHFTGVALELTPHPDLEQHDQCARLRIFDLIVPSRSLTVSLLQLLLLATLAQALALSSPLYLQLIVDEVLVKQDRALLFILICGFSGLFFISLITQTLRSTLSLYLANRLSFSIGSGLFHHLLHLPLDYFEHRHMGDIVSRFGSIKPIQTYLTNSAVILVIDALMVLGSGTLLFVYSPILALIVLAGLAVYLLVRLAVFSPIRSATQETITKDARLDSTFMETIRSIQTIKRHGVVFTKESDWQNQFIDAINSKIKLGNLNTGFESISSLVSSITNLMVIYAGAKMVMDSSISLGMLYALLAYRGHFTSATSSLIDEFINYRMIGLHLERIADIQLTRKERESWSTFHIPVEGAISLKNVSFKYGETDTPIFNNLDLDIKPGEMLAIHGPSGCGKTTLLKLMQGLVQPSEGQVFIDAQPMEGIGGISLRQYTSSLMQEDSLMSGSIKSNICLDDPHTDNDQVLKAAQCAGIHGDIIQLPLGYDTQIGEMGALISAGQVQRLLLARALYRDSRVLFLDEGTAHLDRKTERQVMNNIKNLGITTIFVTHRKSLLSMADSILIMNPENCRLVSGSATLPEEQQ